VKAGIEARLKRGDSQRHEMIFEPDQPVKLFSLGAKGAWAITAQGANAIHAFAHFDGNALWVISTSAGLPALLDGRPVPHRWVIAPVPSVLSFGEAEIVIGAASEEPKTQLIARQVLAPRPALKVSDETVVAPVSPRASLRKPPPPPPPRLLAALRSGPPPPVGLPKLALKDERLTRGALLRIPGEATRVLPSPGLGAVARRTRSRPLAVWRRLPGRRRALAVLLPIALLAVALQAKKPSRGGAVQPSAVGARVAAPSSSPPPGAASGFGRSGMATAASIVSTPDALNASNVLSRSAAPAASASGASDQGKSLERKAADAVVEGDDAAALALYGELSNEYPERAEFGQARAILLRRAQLGAPAGPRQ
jgi:hypothetical protein